MLTQNHGEIGRARRELQDELSKYCRIIIGIKICLNSLVPIARLPNEILLQIFQHYCHIWSRKASRNHIDTWWVGVTGVCHHWREVAMATPTLWAVLDITYNHKRLIELLARSREVALDVRADLSLYPRRDGALAIRSLAKALGRAQSIDLQLFPHSYDLLAEDVPPTATYLRAIKLQCPYNNSEAAPMPTVLNNCDLPSLQDVRIEGYLALWSSPIFAPTLTHLEIRCRKDHAAQGALPGEILNILMNLPALEWLVLINCMKDQPFPVEAPNSSSGSDGAKQVALCRLRYLDLRGCSYPCIFTLVGLNMAGSAKISVVLRWPVHSVLPAAHFQQLSHSITSHLNRNSTAAPIRSVKIKINCDFDLKLKLSLWRDIYDAEEFGTLDPESADCRVYFDPGAYITPAALIGKALNDFCADLPLQSVEVLSITDGTFPLPGMSSWERLLAVLLSVSAVRINGEDTLEGLICLLCEDNLLPLLKTVLLDGARFRPPTEEMDDDELLENLIGAITARKNAGEEISELTLENCINIGEDDVARLEPVVKVVWDEVEEYEDVPPESDEEEEEDEEEDEDEDEEDYCEQCGRAFDM